MTSLTSTITGVTRWGIRLNGVNSTRFGSTIIMRSWSGGWVSNKDATMELMHTLLPLPVEPAIIRWGKLARSITTGAPPVSWPMAIGRPPEAATFLNGALSITSLSITRLGEGLGTSMPTRASPGTGASRRRYGVFRARARSFSRARMLCTFTRPPSPFSGPAAASAPFLWPPPLLATHPGTKPNLTILGPGLISLTATLTPCSPKVLSTSLAMSSKADASLSRGSAGESNSMEGRIQLSPALPAGLRPDGSRTGAAVPASKSGTRIWSSS